MARAQGSVLRLDPTEYAENLVVARRVKMRALGGWVLLAPSLATVFAGIAPSLAALAAFVFFVGGA